MGASRIRLDINKKLREASHEALGVHFFLLPADYQKVMKHLAKRRSQTAFEQVCVSGQLGGRHVTAAFFTLGGHFSTGSKTHAEREKFAP